MPAPETRTLENTKLIAEIMSPMNVIWQNYCEMQNWERCGRDQYFLILRHYTTVYPDGLKNTMNTFNHDSWFSDKILIRHLRKASQICYQYGKLVSKTHKWYITEAIRNKNKLRITRFLTPLSRSLHEKLITQEAKKFFPFFWNQKFRCNTHSTTYKFI